MLEYELHSGNIFRSILLVVHILILFGSLESTEASAYYSLSMESQTKVSSPPVILEEGNCSGTSTIYTNKTSAKVNVTAPLFDYVDNNSSNVDEGADKGTHSNFTAQQYGPDSIYDTLTEEDVGGESTPSSVYAYSYGSVSGGVTNPTYIYGAPDQQYAEIGKNEDIYSNGYDTSTGSITQVYFNVTYYGTPSGTGTIDWSYQLDDGGFTLIKNLAAGGTAGSPLTDTYDATGLRPLDWSWTDINNTDIQVKARGGAGPYTIYVDAIYITVLTQSANYQLDLEVQWTSVDYDETNEELCIYGGTMGSENITVDAWNGSAWKPLFTDLSSGWNNFSVSSYLTSSSFTIRFKGGNETGDATQHSWNIDATLLHVWTSEGTYDYVLQVVNKEVADSWTVNLQVYESLNIARLLKTTISFHDGSSSDQIIVSNGGVSLSEGPPYNLAENATIYLRVTNVQASSSGTSYLYVYLKISVPDKSTYSLYVITFEIT